MQRSGLSVPGLFVQQTQACTCKLQQLPTRFEQCSNHHRRSCTEPTLTTKLAEKYVPYAFTALLLAGSGMSHWWVRNPSTSDAAQTPLLPACLFTFFQAKCNFTSPGRIIDADAPGSEVLLSFMLSKTPETAGCVAIQPVTFVSVRRLDACPVALKRASNPPLRAAVDPQVAVDVALNATRACTLLLCPCLHSLVPALLLCCAWQMAQTSTQWCGTLAAETRICQDSEFLTTL